MNSSFRKHVATAAMLLVPFGAAFVAQPAAAQYYPQYRVATDQGSVTNMTLNSNAGLAPGATLRLEVHATPGARWVSVALGDDGVRVPLRERAPGEYVGTHVIARGERINPRETMMVRAGWGDQPVTVAFNFPNAFQALAMGAGPAVQQEAAVRSFSMWPHDDDDLAPGRVVHFRLEGTPRSRAWVEVPGLRRGVALREVRPGLYTGSATIGRYDDPDAFLSARAVLRNGDERAMAQLNTERRYD
jgi:hypothetical protein